MIGKLSPSAVIMLLAALCGGCSHQTSGRVESSTEMVSFTAPLLAPINWLASLGRGMTASPATKYSPWVTERLNKDYAFSKESVGPALVRFAKKDWGEVTPEQARENDELDGGKGAFGRYPVPGGAVLIVTGVEDGGLKVSFEGEEE